MSDAVILENCRLKAKVGLSEEERQDFQEVTVNLKIDADTSKAGLSDSIEDTINYASVFSAVKWLLEKKSFTLLEAMAESIAHTVLSDFDAEKVTVKVSKQNPPGVDGTASVEITRPKED